MPQIFLNELAADESRDQASSLFDDLFVATPRHSEQKTTLSPDTGSFVPKRLRSQLGHLRSSRVYSKALIEQLSFWNRFYCRYSGFIRPEGTVITTASVGCRSTPPSEPLFIAISGQLSESGVLTSHGKAAIL